VPRQRERGPYFYAPSFGSWGHSAPGFEPERLAEMHLGTYSFILQNYYVEAWADNFVTHLRVSDVRLWWDHIVGLDLARRYGVKTKAPQLEEWGLVAALTDSSGVLWRFAEIPARNSD
jgi:hypothetical protein